MNYQENPLEYFWHWLVAQTVAVEFIVISSMILLGVVLAHWVRLNERERIVYVVTKTWGVIPRRTYQAIVHPDLFEG